MSSNQPNDFSQHISELPYAHSFKRISGVLRQKDEDFKVFETLSFDTTGSGEHLFLLIEKQNCNTEWLAKQLQKLFNVDSKAIGYAGKKDRHSVSQQWFSVQLPGIELSEAEINSKLQHEQYRLIQYTRHNKKLRRGAIAHNRFVIKLTSVKGVIDSDVINTLTKQGFPNYFGYQRFGIDAANITKADQMLKGEIKVKAREKKSMYLSAARSYLFNLQLKERIKQNAWQSAVKGDCFNLNNTNAFFTGDDDNLHSRLSEGDIHVSGWLPGIQPSEASEQAEQIEALVVKPYLNWFEGFKRFKVDSARRTFRVLPNHFQIINISDSEVEVSFELPSGCFATSCLREFCDIEDYSLTKAQEWIKAKQLERQNGN